MQAPRDIQAQLRSLSIPKEQRPRAQGDRAARSRKVGLVSLSILVALILTGYLGRGRIIPAVQSLARSTAKADSIRLITVALTDGPGHSPVLTATGKIVSDHIVSVATKVSGQVVSLHFEQGDRVEQNQQLARIEDVIYRARRDEAAARLERSRANLAFQKINFARVQGLLQLESAPDIEYADAKRALEEGQAQVAADQAALDFSQKALSDCEVVAPIAGVILQRNVEVGDFVAAEGGLGANANARFAVIADMSKLRVEVDISELDIGRIRSEMPCTVIPDAYKDRKYNGYVMWIDPGANYSKATVQVKVRIQDPDDRLRVEGSAQVLFLVDEKQDCTAVGEAAPAIWIPTAALQRDAQSGAYFAYVAIDGRLTKTEVTPGRTRGDRVEITAGLSPGQSIVADGLDRLQDGQRVGS